MNENMYDAWDNGDRHEIRQQLAKRNKKDMTDRELMQQALEALEKIAAYRPLTFAECSDAEAVMGIAENAIPALRERLAQLGQPEWADKCRIELVTAIHSITSDYENALVEQLERFAALVAAAEREACAKVCEEPGWNAANWCAKQIRARGEKT
jgi:hypothetical protein